MHISTVLSLFFTLLDKLEVVSELCKKLYHILLGKSILVLGSSLFRSVLEQKAGCPHSA